MKLLLSLLFAMNLTFAGFSQNNNVKELFDEGEFFFNREDYSEALYYFVQLLKTDPENANFNYKTGSCFLNIPGQEYRAIPYFEKAIKDISTNYNKRSINEKGAPLHTYYYLGNAYRINNELEKALNVYNEFISSPDFYGNYNERIVTEEIKACERAKIISDKPITIKVTNVGENINTKTNDYSVVVSGDENSMVYITTLKFYEGLFYSVKKNGEWTSPQNLNAQVMSDGDMFPTGLSFDGTQLLLVKRSDVNNQIYLSKLENGIWSQAMLLSDNINSRHNENYASLSKDGNTIYFTSDRRGGYGGYDIYKSVKMDGQWKEAVNLGEVVNSPFNEAAPFINEKGNKLYFASDGHFTMGGYDIFYSELENNQWSRPENIGFPINTTSDNDMYVPVGNGKSGYMSLSREDGYGGKDIYLVQITKGETTKNTAVENENLADHSNKVMVKLLDEKTSDTTIIWFDKGKERFYFDVPEGVKVIQY